MPAAETDPLRLEAIDDLLGQALALADIGSECLVAALICEARDAVARRRAELDRPGDG